VRLDVHRAPFFIPATHSYKEGFSGWQTPAEVGATIYKSLGIDIETELPGPSGRPFPEVNFGTKEIRELFGVRRPTCYSCAMLGGFTLKDQAFSSLCNPVVARLVGETLTILDL
jgi:hypothetical protein